MESYSLPEHIKPIAFLIKNSQIDGRLDPNYNRLKIEVEQELAKSIYPVKRIKDVLSKIQYGTSSLANTERKGVPILRMNNIQDDDLDLTDIKHIELSQKEIDNISLNKGDILFNRTNSKELVGKCVVFNESEKWVYASYIIRVVLDKTEVLPKYASYFLNARLGRLQVDCISRQIAGMTNINAEEIKSLKLIVPPIKKQEEFVAIIDEAKKKKFELKKKASDTLDSIDSYILNELGITLPEKDTRIEARMFQTTFKELSGRRFDPKLFDTYSKNLFAAVENAQYPIEPLKNLITHSAAGDWGIDEEAEVKQDQYDTCLVIRATEFDNLYNLKLENDRVRYRKIKKDKLKQLDIQPYDLLIEKSGGSPDQPVGRISLLTEDLFENNTLCYSNFIHKIRVDISRVDPSYLFCFLKTIHNIKITEIMQSQTNGIRNLIMGEYFNQSIVLPKLDKQIEIGQEANRRRFEAQRLSIVADKVLEDARAEIEQMILEP
ncbi:restriction endonuclease subunit S [Marinoscillum furvescens]|uniref:Type I restriction modification DNA specificity protein n=1 Tax=Marinoscillum furvescens DSM 4134 TaxID=1122208 RepID=A0A3D9KW58_MARFU|nr:restriction endonuclease subunit S [Marinoscillum furvescens]RED92193.1 type I restriction modification DNA specificity protein [Marinoscillum furvescens DSM 4134]